MKIATPIDSKSDILQMILDRSPVGLITAVPIGEVLGVNQMIDGRIVSINARAKELLKFDEKGSQVHFIRDLALWLRDSAGWTRTDIKAEGKTTHIYYRDAANRRYTVIMEAVRRYVLFSILEEGPAVFPDPAG
jgi:PAS domain-containing protein